MRKGFTLVELVIAAVILGIITFAVLDMTGPMIEHNKKERTLERMQKIADALNFHYEAVVAYRKQNPGWVTQADCSVARSWLVPPGCWSYADKLVLWKDSTTPADSQILQQFEDAGCKLVSDGTGYEVECYDGWGNPMHFSYSYGNETHAVPYPANPGTPITITITSAGRDGVFGTADDLKVVWSSASLDERYRHLSYDELSSIADALDAYFRNRLSYEVTKRIYPEGLPEEDDINVDWYLQLCTAQPQDYCQDSTCSNIAAVWPSVTCDGNVLRNTCDITTVLSHLNLDPNQYETDAFGNPIYINLCYDPDGDGYPNGAPPALPASDRGPFSASVSDGSITVMSTGE
jgi:prepilin-type N-terminal cleavage/methylation domain-containing protein